MSSATLDDQSQPASARRMYNARAAVYDNSWHPSFALNFLNLVGLEPGGRVLDLACGTGLVTELAAERVGPQGYVIGVDISDGMLAEAEKKCATFGARIQLRNHSIADLPSLPELKGQEGTFDVVACASAVVLLADPVAAIAQWSRYLKPSTGKLIFDVIPPNNIPQGFIMETAVRSMDLPMYFNRHWMTGEAALRKVIEQAGTFESLSSSRTRTDQKIEAEKIVFMRQQDFETKTFDGDEDEGQRQFESLISIEAFKHIKQHFPEQLDSLRQRFVQLWIAEGKKDGGDGKVIEKDGVLVAVCTSR